MHLEVIFEITDWFQSNGYEKREFIWYKDRTAQKMKFSTKDLFVK